VAFSEWGKISCFLRWGKMLKQEPNVSGEKKRAKEPDPSTGNRGLCTEERAQVNKKIEDWQVAIWSDKKGGLPLYGEKTQGAK